jgi:serine/threonine-protein kinase RsbW
MSQEQWIWRRDHVIPSDTAAGRRVLSEVLRQLELRRWCPRDIFAVHLAMEEALVNAITHGNRLDPDKHVRISCRMSPELIRVEISDEGPGFDPTTVPNPTDPDRLECPSGRGVLLMKAFMSRVEWGGSGNRVLLERKRGNTE